MTSFFVSQNKTPEVFDAIRENTEIESICGIHAHEEAPYVEFKFENPKECIQAKKAAELSDIPTYLGVA